MFQFIRRHQAWALVLIGLVIISFVVFFSPDLQLSGPRQEHGTLKGRPITDDQFQKAVREAQLFYFMRMGEWPTDQAARQFGFNLRSEAYNRLLLAEKARELNIHVDTETVAQWIGKVFEGDGRQKFRLEEYQRFVNETLRPAGFSEGDFERFARHQIAAEHMASLFGAAGSLAPPQEAEFMYRRENELMAAQAVFFQGTNHLDQVSPAEEDVTVYFARNMARYRNPMRVQVEVIKFEAAKHYEAAEKEMEKRTDLQPQIAAIYQQRGANFYKDDEDNLLPAETAHAQIRAEIRNSIALDLAQKDAYAFANRLYDEHNKETDSRDRDLLEKLAAEEGLAVQVTEPFTEQEGPAEFKVPNQFIRAAFNLTQDEPHASPVRGEDAMYLIGLKRRIPPQAPPLDSIREQVTEDFRQARATELARDAGASFAGAVRAGLEEGKTFEAICAEQNVTPVVLPPFALTTRSLPELEDRVPLRVLQEAAYNLRPGQASDFVGTAEGGLLVHLTERLPVAEEKLQSELPDYLERIRQQRQTIAFNEWMQKQVQEMQLLPPAPEAPEQATQ